MLARLFVPTNLSVSKVLQSLLLLVSSSLPSLPVPPLPPMKSLVSLLPPLASQPPSQPLPFHWQPEPVCHWTRLLHPQPSQYRWVLLVWPMLLLLLFEVRQPPVSHWHLQPSLPRFSFDIPVNAQPLVIQPLRCRSRGCSYSLLHARRGSCSHSHGSSRCNVLQLLHAPQQLLPRARQRPLDVLHAQRQLLSQLR